jgi:hypothetical protein
MLHRKAEKELEKLNLDVKGRIIEAFKEMKKIPSLVTLSWLKD